VNSTGEIGRKRGVGAKLILRALGSSSEEEEGVIRCVCREGGRKNRGDSHACSDAKKHGRRRSPTKTQNQNSGDKSCLLK